MVKHHQHIVLLFPPLGLPVDAAVRGLVPLRNWVKLPWTGQLGVTSIFTLVLGDGRAGISLFLEVI